MDIPRRSYTFSRDPFAIVTLYREKTSITARKTRTVLAERRTAVMKRNSNPTFGSSLGSEIDENDLKSYKVKIVLFDADKNTKVTQLGSATIPLKTVRSALVSEEENSQLEFSLCAKMTPKEVNYFDNFQGILYHFIRCFTDSAFHRGEQLIFGQNCQNSSTIFQ